MKLLKFIITIFFVFTLCGCSKEIVARGIDQKQANEIVSIFAKSNITSKVVDDPNAKKLLMVQVSKKDYKAATTILTLKGLPRDKSANFSEMISRQGILPDSKRIEDLRLDKALALEIEDNLSKMQEFANVSVVVRKEYLKDDKAPLASILVIKKPHVGFFDERKILNIVKTVIPEIKDENIKIIVDTETVPPHLSNQYGSISKEKGEQKLVRLNKFLGKFRIASDDYKQFNIFLAIIVLASLLVGFLGSLFYIKLKNIRKEKSKIVEISSKDLLKEASFEKRVVKKGNNK
ncbi:MAG: hypothetical protein ACOX3T_06095 [Bdellovibrionota bacterium]